MNECPHGLFDVCCTNPSYCSPATRSEKLREAGITRRPRGWSKEDEPEPVAWLNKTKHGTWSADAFKCEGDEPSEPLYTTPPKKEWVGLTTDEVFELSSTRLPHGLFAGLIEAKLKEKNT